MWNQIKKEWCISIRSNGILILFIALIQAIFPFMLGNDIYKLITNQEILKVTLLNTILYFPLMSMPLVAMLVAEAVMSEERKERILQVLFANGVEKKVIWKSKIIFACVISYVFNVICVLLAMFYLKITYGVWLSMDWYHGIRIFLMFPLLAFAIIDIMVTLIWTRKEAKLYIGFLPSLSYIGLIYLSSVKNDLFTQLFNNEMLFWVIIGVSLVFVISECIVSKLTKEYLINVNC